MKVSRKVRVVVQLNSIYQTPRDFIKILYWSCNLEKAGFTEEPAERAAGKSSEQLQTSGSASGFTFRVTVGSKCGGRKIRSYRKQPASE